MIFVLCFCISNDKVKPGVPRGSVLGSSLILVYLNDIGSSLRHLSYSLFAYNALLYCPTQNTCDMVSFQQYLSSLEQFENEWCMTFNVKKCQMILFEGRFVIDKAAVVYTLYEAPMVVVDSFKYQGVFMSNNFVRDMHIDDITSWAYQRLEMIKRVLNKAPLKVKKSCIFNSLQTNNGVCLRGLGPISC